MGYNGYTEAKKQSNKRYMEKRARLVLWCDPEEKKDVERAAHISAESVNAYIKKAIRDRMKAEALEEDPEEKTI